MSDNEGAIIDPVYGDQDAAEQPIEEERTYREALPVDIVVPESMSALEPGKSGYFGVTNNGGGRRSATISTIPKEIIPLAHFFFRSGHNYRNSNINTQNYHVYIDHHGNVWYNKRMKKELSTLVWRVLADDAGEISFHRYSKMPHINPFDVNAQRQRRMLERPRKDE